MGKKLHAWHFKLSILASLFILLAACSTEESTPTPEEAVEPTETVRPVQTEVPAATPRTTEAPGIQQPETEGITGIVWQWQAFQDTAAGEDVEVDEPEKYTLVLYPNGTAAIQADCNQTTLGYVLEDNDISFSATGPTTMAFCGEDSLDKQYVGLLIEAVSWFVDDQGRLVLNLPFDSGNLLFEAGETVELPSGQPETVDAAIIGVPLEWQGFQDPAGINDITVDEPTQYTLFLEPGGQAAIQADCNQLSLAYELDGSSLTFEDTGPSTLAFCGEDSLDQQYLELLSNVAEWFLLEDEILFLNLWADGGSMIFLPGASLESASATACPAGWFMGETTGIEGTRELPVPDTCPEGPAMLTSATSQPFEKGRMIWLEESDAFYILFNEGASPLDSRQNFIALGPLELKAGASVDNRVDDEPPLIFYEPESNFGLIWRNEVVGLDLDIREALGWAVGPELVFATALQCQEQQNDTERICYLLDVNGNLIVLSNNAVDGDMWRKLEGS